MNIHKLDYFLPFWSEWPVSIPDTQTLYKVFSYAAKCEPLVDSDGTDSLILQHFKI